jgi:pimeloyl-ACP methyl ester carboxylesterase
VRPFAREAPRRVVSAGDAEVLVREWGSEGPPIFFWHALGDHTSLQLVDAAPILVDEFGYRLVGVDAPGFGGSPRLPDERYEIPALIELALDFLDTLGLDPVVWAGSSWGGNHRSPVCGGASGAPGHPSARRRRLPRSRA